MSNESENTTASPTPVASGELLSGSVVIMGFDKFGNKISETVIINGKPVSKGARKDVDLAIQSILNVFTI